MSCQVKAAMHLISLRLSSALSSSIFHPTIIKVHKLTAQESSHLLSLRLSNAIGGGLGAGSAPNVTPARQGIAVQCREAPAQQHHCARDQAPSGPHC